MQKIHFFLQFVLHFS